MVQLVTLKTNYPVVENNLENPASSETGFLYVWHSILKYKLTKFNIIGIICKKLGTYIAKYKFPELGGVNEKIFMRVIVERIMLE